MTKRRALICACGLLLAVLAFRVFFIQELFFAFLFFALAYLLLLLLVAVVQGHRALPVFRILVLWFAPTVTETAQVLSVGHRILFYPFYGLFRGWSQSLRRDVSQFREDTERAVKHLRLLLKHN